MYFNLLICSLFPSLTSTTHTAKHGNTFQPQEHNYQIYTGEESFTQTLRHISTWLDLQNHATHTLTASLQSGLFEFHCVLPEDGACPQKNLKKVALNALSRQTSSPLFPAFLHLPCSSLSFSHLYTLSLYVLLPNINLREKCIKRKGSEGKV